MPYLQRKEDAEKQCLPSPEGLIFLASKLLMDQVLEIQQNACYVHVK